MLSIPSSESMAGLRVLRGSMRRRLEVLRLARASEAALFCIEARRIGVEHVVAAENILVKCRSYAVSSGCSALTAGRQELGLARAVESPFRGGVRRCRFLVRRA